MCSLTIGTRTTLVPYRDVEYGQEPPYERVQPPGVSDARVVRGVAQVEVWLRARQGAQPPEGLGAVGGLVVQAHGPAGV